MTINRHTTTSPPPRTIRRRSGPIVLALLSLTAAGCGSELETRYGQRTGIGAGKSLNGTAVLCDMFKQAGHNVFSWRKLSSTLHDRADCIVWFPNDFEPPDEEVRDWLEDWLYAQPDRTLIYVGRDFDATALYWKKIQPGAPAEQLPLVRDRKTEAEDRFLMERKAADDSGQCDWFIAEGKYRPYKVHTLGGPWSEGIDASKTEIELSGRIEPAPYVDVDVLLESVGNDPQPDLLVSREEFVHSQVIVVANGSFLLNLPLVNHEHRKLAGKLIDAIGPPEKTVVFLESGPGGPPIGEEEPPSGVPSGLEIAMIVPLCWIFLHLGALGVTFCFSRWSIFGLPRRLGREDTSDFGKHVRAMAELLERSGDRKFAMTRLLHYRQTTKGNE